MTDSPSFSRYLPVEPSLVDWGFYILDAGHTQTQAGLPYPSGKHPQQYVFTWERGRVLDEFQIIYITRGQGIVEWGEGNQVTLTAGDIYLIYPGVWHRYRPNVDEGWEESWIGFNGDYAEQLMSRFFSPERPVLRVGYDDELIKKMQRVLSLMQETPAGYRQMMSGETVAIIARIRSLNMRSNKEVQRHERKMDQARFYLLKHVGDEINFEKLALDLGYSYSRFRLIFKRHTGQSPLQYQLDIRINRAKELLRESSKSVSEIADELGFGSVYYFSRMFKKRTGVPPSELR